VTPTRKAVRGGQKRYDLQPTEQELGEKIKVIPMLSGA
jgi:hypothetical protein